MDRNACDYTSLYCEENVWRLALDARFGDGLGQVALISNATRSVALGAQRAGENGIVVWDYHVVLCEPQFVYDLDSLLPFPCPLDKYIDETFGHQSALPERFRSQVRLVNAAHYGQRLFSDRSHMRGPEGAWLAQPPPWPAPSDATRTWKLSELLDMKRPEPGRVLTPAEWKAFSPR